MTEVQKLAKIRVLKDLYKEYELLAKYNGGIDYDRYCALEMAIKALEQESVLDKIEEEIKDTLYVDSLIFTELIDFKNGKIDADDVIEEFNRVTRLEVLRVIEKYKAKSEDKK